MHRRFHSVYWQSFVRSVTLIMVSLIINKVRHVNVKCYTEKNLVTIAKCYTERKKLGTIVKQKRPGRCDVLDVKYSPHNHSSRDQVYGLVLFSKRNIIAARGSPLSRLSGTIGSLASDASPPLGLWEHLYLKWARPTFHNCDQCWLFIW